MNEHNFDWIIKNSLIFDGTGETPYKADIGIKDEKIAFIGNLSKAHGNIIDASGLAVSPGFIDIHTHDDIPIILDPLIPCKVMQGVTTSVTGCCGSSVFPFEAAEKHRAQSLNYEKLPVKWNSFNEYMSYVDNEPSAINIVLQAGHNTIRTGVMGKKDKKSSRSELLSMMKIFEEGMEAGVSGFSTGLYYVPGCYADLKEVMFLAEIMRGTKSVYSAHIRDEADFIIDAIQEAVDIGSCGEVPVQISHIKCEGRNNWGRAGEVIDFIELKNREGNKVSMDIYPYTASSTSLSSILRVSHGQNYEGLSVPAEDILIVSSQFFPEYNGKTVRQISKEEKLSPKQITDKILQLEDVTVVHLNDMHEDDISLFLNHSLTSIGSDGLHTAKGNPHPRLYGSFPRVIGRYSREKKIITLETAIRKMTGLNADRYNLKNRGYLKQGYFADIVTFDKNNIIDKGTFLDSKAFPEGIKNVFVNGRIVVKDGVQTGSRAGKMLRRNDCSAL